MKRKIFVGDFVQFMGRTWIVSSVKNGIELSGSLFPNGNGKHLIDYQKELDNLSKHHKESSWLMPTNSYKICGETQLLFVKKSTLPSFQISIVVSPYYFEEEVS